MKKLYEFVVPKEEEVIKKETSTNDAGESITTEKKVKEKVEHKFFISRPNRSTVEEGELYYGVEMANGVKAGLLTAPQLYKRFLNDGGILSEPEKLELETARTDLMDLQAEYQKLSLETDKTEEQAKRLEEVLQKIIEIRDLLQRFEYQQSSFFNQTAETRARNKVIFWYTLNLAYAVNKDGKEEPFFKGATLNDKIKHYDEMEEKEDEFLSLVTKKFLYLISFWYMGRAKNEEDFKQIDQIADEIDEQN